MNRKDQPTKAQDEVRSGLGGWDDDGGAVSSDRGLKNEIKQEESGDRSAHRAAFDTSHESSTRGEHRYPDTHQTNAERKARDDRDALKRRLERGR